MFLDYNYVYNLNLDMMLVRKFTNEFTMVRNNNYCRPGESAYNHWPLFANCSGIPYTT